VAHEVKNPLQTILMGLEYLTRNLRHPDENTTIALTDMNDAVKRADGIVRELLHFAGATKFDCLEQDLNALVTRALWLVNTQLVAARIDVELNLAETLPPVWIDRGKIEQVLLNLFINAHQAMAQKGTLTVRTRAGQFSDLQPLNSKSRSRFSPADTVVIVEIQDTGPGIPEAQLSRIFDPFFTTKPVGVGTGLGLSVVKKIVDLHEGAIEIRNVPQRGALAVVVFKAITNKLS
jgi:signal transduction histidine kinase